MRACCRSRWLLLATILRWLISSFRCAASNWSRCAASNWSRCTVRVTPNRLLFSLVSYLSLSSHCWCSCDASNWCRCAVWIAPNRHLSSLVGCFSWRLRSHSRCRNRSCDWCGYGCSCNVRIAPNRHLFSLVGCFSWRLRSWSRSWNRSCDCCRCQIWISPNSLCSQLLSRTRLRLGFHNWCRRFNDWI